MIDSRNLRAGSTVYKGDWYVGVKFAGTRGSRYRVSRFRRARSSIFQNSSEVSGSDDRREGQESDAIVR